MKTPPCLSALLLAAGMGFAHAADVPKFGRHEVVLTATGTYGNPYVEVAAEAMLTAPDGRSTRALPLFWDGGSNWKLRFAPDRTGTWKWSVKSTDTGLDGRTGAFTCVASNRRGSIQQMDEAPRHFQYQNGERMWFMGDTAWAYVLDDPAEQHDRTSASRYVEQRAAQGFNAIHLMLLSEAGWPNQGGPPWHDIAAEKLNPAYFQEAERRIEFANARGLVTGIVLAWGSKSRREPWSWSRFPNLEARKRFARHVAARFGAFDCYFIVAGEWHGEVRSRSAKPDDIMREFIAIGDALRGADAHRRMTGIHPMTAHGSTREYAAAAQWMDFADYQQNYLDLHARVLASRGVARPVVNSEYGYYLRDQNGDGRVDKQNSYTVDDMRHATWDIVMAGGYVVTGFGSTYMGGFRHPTPFLPDDPKNAAWAGQIGKVKKFFESLEYWRLEPHDELLSCSSPRTADRTGRIQAGNTQLLVTQPPAMTYWCLADPGRRYVVYVRGTKEPVRLELRGEGGWKVESCDPRSGARQERRPKFEAGAVALAAPDEQDWVFVVTRK